MRTTKILMLPALIGLLAGCATSTETNADISKLAELKSSFPEGYTVDVVPITGIDPERLRQEQKLPEGVTFDPAECSKLAGGQELPEDLRGNMTAVQAVGEGNRFIVIAMETSEPLPLAEPGEECQKVSFAGSTMRGTIEVVPAPEIKEATTSGVHRVMQANVGGKEQTGHLYSYVAQFGNYRVMVTADPVVEADKPTVPVNTELAEKLLTDGVADIRG